MGIRRRFLKFHSLQTKMLTIIGSMLAVLVFYFALSTWSANNYIDTLLRASTQVFPSLQAADSNLFLSERLKESLYAAVGTHEADEIKTADALAAQIRDGFAKIMADDPESAVRAKQMAALFEAYYADARALSWQLATGKVNLGDAAAIASMETMKKDSESFNADLKEFRAQRNQYFAASIDKARAGAREVVNLGYFLMGTAAVAFIVMLVLLRKQVIAPIVALSRLSQEVSQGRFNAPEHSEAADEIAVLNNNFATMIRDIQTNQATLEQIVIQGRRLSAASTSYQITVLIQGAFEKLARVGLDCTVWFSSVCFLEEDLEGGFYQVSDYSEPARWSLISAAELAGEATGHIVWVLDPRSGGRLAAIRLMTTKEAVLAKALPTLEALATNVANAIAAIRLEQAMGLLETRTKQIHTIFASISQGICILDDQMRIGPDYSLSLEKIVGRPKLSGASLQQVWLNQTMLAADVVNQIGNAIAISVGEDLINFEVNSEVLPREVICEESGQRTVVELDWIPMVGSEGQVVSVMLTLRDVTEVRKLKEAEAARRSETEMIEQLLRQTPQRFAAFASLTAELFDRVSGLSQGLGSLSEVQHHELARDLHTLKGNSRAMGLSALAQALHEVESTLFVWRRATAEDPNARDALIRLVADACALFRSYQALNDDKLRRGGIGLPRDMLQKGFSLLESKVAARRISASDARELMDFLLGQGDRPLAELVQTAFAGLPALCRQLHQPLPHLDIVGDHCLVPSRWAEVMIGVFNHLLRNSVGHALKQQPAPVIYVRTELDVPAGLVRVDYRDSGRGLDLASLRSIGLSQGNIAATASDLEVANLIFVSGLSTAGSVTDIAGRGVGMEAVRAALAGAGGGAEVQLADGMGDFRPFSLRLSFKIDSAQDLAAAFVPEPVLKAV